MSSHENSYEESRPGGFELHVGISFSVVYPFSVVWVADDY